jgi:hypothetical protein
LQLVSYFKNREKEFFVSIDNFITTLFGENTMKIASLLAGVAALALSAVAAQAGDVYHASLTTSSAGGPVINIPGFGNLGVAPNFTFNEGHVQSNLPATAPGDYLKLISPSIINNSTANIAMIEIQGHSENNNGVASTTAGATFTLKGNVTKDCAYYTGNASTTVDFGTIGIYASDATGPAAAFDMTAPATVSIDTNLAGCNTSNTVTVTKSNANGLINNAGVGYDSNVFQANLPYTVIGSYTAGSVGSTAAGTTGNWINLNDTDATKSATHGAWKSAMSLDVLIPVPSKSLLAGNYQGDLSVSITAF